MKRLSINHQLVSPFVKLPLYLGLAVFVLTVIVSSVTIGERGAVFNSNLQAKEELPKISLIFSKPSSLTLSVVGKQKIKGIDLVLKYDPKVVEILPSTLSGFSQNLTSGGEADPAAGIFSFSALSNLNNFQNNLIASFKINLLSEKLDPASFVSIDTVKTRVYILDNNSFLKEIPFDVVK